MAYVLAVAAALANCVTTVLQRRGVETAPEAHQMRWGLIAHAVRRPVWVIGSVLMLGAFVLQAAALGLGRLSIVQPMLTLELPMLVVVMAVFFGRRPGWTEWAGSVVLVAGLGAFLAVADPGGGARQPGADKWLLCAAAGVALIAVAVALGLTGRPAWRAFWLGTASATCFAFTAAFAKTVAHQFARHWWLPVTHWELWAVALSGALGFFLMQNAFHAGPITVSLAALVVVDPLLSIGIGVGLFGDQLHAHGVRLPIEIAALAVMCAGGVALARSPVVATVKAESEGEGPSAPDRPTRHAPVVAIVGAPVSPPPRPVPLGDVAP